MDKDLLHAAFQTQTKDDGRIWIESVAPSINGGEFSIKRTVGERVEVRANVLVDRDEPLCVALCFRAESDENWTELALSKDSDESWCGGFQIKRCEPYFYTVIAWLDELSAWKRTILKPVITSAEFAEAVQTGLELFDPLLHVVSEKDLFWLDDELQVLEAGSDLKRIRSFISSKRLAKIYAKYAPRKMLTEYPQICEVWVDRRLARSGSWFRLSDWHKLNTDELCDAVERAARLGFDVLQLSQSEDSVPEQLLERVRRHAAKHKIELALQLAFRFSEQHPVRVAHPSWFKNSELTFEHPEWDQTWAELKQLVSSWAEKGFRTFSLCDVDSLPFPFLTWLIDELRLDYPDVLFISDPVASPRHAATLAKIGFAQTAFRVSDNRALELANSLADSNTMRPHLLVERLIEHTQAAATAILATMLQSSFSMEDKQCSESTWELISAINTLKSKFTKSEAAPAVQIKKQAKSACACLHLQNAKLESLLVVSECEPSADLLGEVLPANRKLEQGLMRTMSAGSNFYTIVEWES